MKHVCVRWNGTNKTLFELDRNDLRNSGFLHGYAVKRSGGLHGAFVVSDYDELRLFGHLGDLVDESADVRVVERSIDFVAERRNGQ